MDTILNREQIILEQYAYASMQEKTCVRESDGEQLYAGKQPRQENQVRQMQRKNIKINC